MAVTPVGPSVPAPRLRELERRQALDDAAEAALAVVAVAGALVRYAGSTAARAGRRLRFPLSLVAHPVTTVGRAVAVTADALVPDVARAVLARLDVPALVGEFVDIDRVASLLDVDAVVARADLDAVVERVDIDRILDRVDLDAVIARVDLDAVIDRVDILRILDRIDLDAVVARVDLDRAVARVDLDRAVARVDLDRAVDRVDLDRAVDRVDVDRVVARTDLAGLARYVVQEIDLPGLVRASTGSVTTEMVRSVRDQGVDADRAVERVVDRLLHRQGRRTGTVEDGDRDRR